MTPTLRPGRRCRPRRPAPAGSPAAGRRRASRGQTPSN